MADMSGGGLGIDEEGELGIDGVGAETCWSVGAGPNEPGTPDKHPTSVRGKAGDGHIARGRARPPWGPGADGDLNEQASGRGPAGH